MRQERAVVSLFLWGLVGDCESGGEWSDGPKNRLRLTQSVSSSRKELEEWQELVNEMTSRSERFYVELFLVVSGCLWVLMLVKRAEITLARLWRGPFSMEAGLPVCLLVVMAPD